VGLHLVLFLTDGHCGYSCIADILLIDEKLSNIKLTLGLNAALASRLHLKVPRLLHLLTTQRITSWWGQQCTPVILEPRIVVIYQFTNAHFISVLHYFISVKK